MKKRLITLMFFIVVVLLGCSENPALISNNSSPIEGAQNLPEVEQEERTINLPFVSVGTETGATSVYQDVWCWKEEELCSLDPNSPIEILNEQGFSPLRVKPGEVFDISIAYNDISDPDHLAKPDVIEVVQYNWKEEGKEVEVRNKQIKAPTEKGRFYYSLKFQWNGELVGQAYFTFGINVQ